MSRWRKESWNRWVLEWNFVLIVEKASILNWVCERVPWSKLYPAAGGSSHEGATVGWKSGNNRNQVRQKSSKLRAACLEKSLRE